MAVSGEQNIRGIDIDKLAKGFADEEIIFKKFCTITPTSAREIRWYQKTAGFLDSTDTTGITASQIANVAPLALPVVVEQSWTRNTSYIRKYFVESPIISDEDIRDSDIDIIATNIRDLTRAVARQVDSRIYNVISEDQTAVNITTTPTMAAWDVAGSADPIRDILSGSKLIRNQGYEINDLVLLISPTDYANLMGWLISTKGASIPSFASDKIESGVLMKLLTARIVVSNNTVADNALLFVPQRACTWKTFVPITARSIEEVGIGTKIRVWEEGEAILTDPKAVCLITNTVT